MAKLEFEEVKKVFENALDKKYLDQLDENGYVLLARNNQSSLRSSEDLENMRNKLDALVAEEGIKGGWEGLEFVLEREPEKPAESGAKRIVNLINKDMCFIKLATRPDVLAATYHLMRGKFKLSAAGLREPLPGEGL